MRNIMFVASILVKDVDAPLDLPHASTIIRHCRRAHASSSHIVPIQDPFFCRARDASRVTAPRESHTVGVRAFESCDWIYATASDGFRAVDVTCLNKNRCEAAHRCNLIPYKDHVSRLRSLLMHVFRLQFLILVAKLT